MIWWMSAAAWAVGLVWMIWELNHAPHIEDNDEC